MTTLRSCNSCPALLHPLLCPALSPLLQPTNSSRGRGIRMVTRPDSIPRDAKDTLVQHYIANPLLLDGYKFDMR